MWGLEVNCREKSILISNHLWTCSQSCGYMRSSPKLILRMDLVLARHEFISWESLGWLTSKDVKCEVSKYLAPSRNQQSRGERIEEGDNIPKLHFRYRELGESRCRIPRFPKS
jgi:hypothetical protein